MKEYNIYIFFVIIYIYLRRKTTNKQTNESLILTELLKTMHNSIFEKKQQYRILKGEKRERAGFVRTYIQSTVALSSRTVARQYLIALKKKKINLS